MQNCKLFKLIKKQFLILPKRQKLLRSAWQLFSFKNNIKKITTPILKRKINPKLLQFILKTHLFCTIKSQKIIFNIKFITFFSMKIKLFIIKILK